VSPTVSLDHALPEMSKCGCGAFALSIVRQDGAILMTCIGIAQRTALPEGVLTNIAEAHLDTLLADARPLVTDAQVDAEGVRLHEQVAEWDRQVREELRQTYGAKDAEDLLARTQRFVRQHRSLAKILQQRGLGSRPDIVRELVSFVFSNGLGRR
jgi:DNA polymerase III gamma/tau subunit